VRVVEGRFVVPLGLEPVSRPLVEHGHELRLAVLELLPQQVAKEMVVAVGAAVPVEWHDEQALLFQRGELERRALSVQDGVAERAGHCLQHGATTQEPEPIRLQAQEVFRAEVVGEVAVGPGDGTNIRLLVALGTGGKRAQVEPGRPTLGALDEVVDLVVVELQACRTQEQLGFPPAERELIWPELEQRPARPQRRDRQLGDDAAGEHDHRSGRDVPDECSHGRDRVAG
jgi:hypothetical protein